MAVEITETPRHTLTVSEQNWQLKLSTAGAAGVASLPDDATFNTVTVNTLLTAAHIHGNIAGQLYVHVEAQENLTKGDPVYVSGYNNGTSEPKVRRAQADDNEKMPAIGVIDATYTAGHQGANCIISGIIENVNTQGFGINKPIYVGPNGGFTAIKPATNPQQVGICDRDQQNNGSFVITAKEVRPNQDLNTTSSVNFDSLTLASDIFTPTGESREWNFQPLASPTAPPVAGQVYYDSDLNKLRCYSGTSWNDLFPNQDLDTTSSVNFESLNLTDLTASGTVTGGAATFTTINGSGLATISNSLNVAYSITCGTGSNAYFKWFSKSAMGSSVDGNITFYNAGLNDFGRLSFGGITSSFPAIKRNGAAINIRLADDSADAPLTCSNLTASGLLSAGAGKIQITNSGLGMVSSSAGNPSWYLGVQGASVLELSRPTSTSVQLRNHRDGDILLTSAGGSVTIGVGGNLTASGTVTTGGNVLVGNASQLRAGASSDVFWRFAVDGQGNTNIAAGKFYGWTGLVNLNGVVVADVRAQRVASGHLELRDNVGGYAQLDVSNLTASGTVKTGSKTVAAANALSGVAAGSLLWITNEAGGACTAEYNGTAWVRVRDQIAISE